MLIHFLSDHLRNRPVDERFAADPAGLMAQYGLSAAAQEALRTRDARRIAELLTEELQRNLTVPAPISLGWGGVAIKVTGSTPSQAHAGQTIRVAVSGEKFPPANDATLLFLDGDARHSGKVESVVTDLQGNSTLHGTVQFDSTHVGTSFDVVVTNGQQSAAGRSPAQLTVVAE
jgi:hypothetical protein